MEYIAYVNERFYDTGGGIIRMWEQTKNLGVLSH